MGRRNLELLAGVVAAVAIVLAATQDAGAQNTTAQVSGVVREEATSAPIEGAQVRIPERGLQVLTRPDGRFAFAAVPSGTYTLRVDRIGYGVVEDVLTVGASDVTVPISLVTQALELGEIVVSPGHFGVMGNAAVRPQQTLTREDLETVPQILPNRPDGPTSVSAERPANLASLTPRTRGTKRSSQLK